MKSYPNIIRPLLANDNNSMYLVCQPLSPSPPYDIPEIKHLSRKYWTARFLSKDEMTVKTLSEWFSIPRKNIKSVINKYPEGPFIISINDLTKKQQEELLSETKPMFKIDRNLDNESLRWLHRFNSKNE